MIQSNFWNGNLSFFIENFTFAIKSESSRVVSYILHLLYSECPVIWIYQNKVFYHMCLVYWEALTWMSIIDKMMITTWICSIKKLLWKGFCLLCFCLQTNSSLSLNFTQFPLKYHDADGGTLNTEVASNENTNLDYQITWVTTCS